MEMYSALYQSHSDPFGLTTNPPTTVLVPEDIPENAKGFLLLHGGEDISPSIYGEKVNNFCHAPSTPSKRDEAEIALIHRARELDLIILGICRGAQLLCALDGGKLAQHIIGHTSQEHSIINPSEGNSLGKSNTAHHQMMLPRTSKTTKVLGIVNQPIMYYSEDNKLRTAPNVPEIIVYQKMRAFGVQFHPEWMNITDPIVKWCRSYISNYLVREY